MILQKLKARLLSRNKQSSGMTLVELLITVTLVAIVSLTLANFTANWLKQSAVTQARTDLLTNAQSGLDLIGNDIRLSGAADQNNRWPDDNAPGAPGNKLSWQSNSNTLVLASVAMDSHQNVIFSDSSQYVSEKNNQIYFVNNKTLYRRTLASIVAGNSAVTTCPSTTVTSTCPADKIVATNVDSFSVQYYDADGSQVTPPNARSIGLSISMSSKQYGQTTNISDSTRMVFRND